MNKENRKVEEDVVVKNHHRLLGEISTCICIKLFI